MLKYRLIFGPLMIAGALLLFYLDNLIDRVSLDSPSLSALFHGRPHLPRGLLMLVLFLSIVVLGAREMCAIFRAKGIQANPLLVALSGMIGMTLLYAIPYRTSSQNTMAVFATALTLVFIASMLEYSWFHRRTEGAVAVAGVTMLAMMYMGVVPGFYIAIRRWHSAWVVAAIILVTKACDIGAFATGKLIGRHKLIPWLSPGKTWEGLAGGVLLSSLLALGLAALRNHLGDSMVYIDPAHHAAAAQTFRYPLLATCVAGALLGLLGQFGDLTASLFKRDAGIKDSGDSIPGFGGLLDVVDSPIVVAPFAYWMLRLAVAWGAT